MIFKYFSIIILGQLCLSVSKLPHEPLDLFYYTGMDIDLEFDVVVAQSDPQHIVWAWHLMLLHGIVYYIIFKVISQHEMI